MPHTAISGMPEQDLSLLPPVKFLQYSPFTNGLTALFNAKYFKKKCIKSHFMY